jgi:hypothetical protein
MTPRSRRLILARVLDPKYEHPRSMRIEVRIKRLLALMYSAETISRTRFGPAISRMVKRG